MVCTALQLPGTAAAPLLGGTYALLLLLLLLRRVTFREERYI